MAGGKSADGRSSDALWTDTNDIFGPNLNVTYIRDGATNEYFLLKFLIPAYIADN